MNILILNWRDPKNPRSGGAEKVTFKYAEYWAKQGHSVIWICNSFPGCVSNESIKDVKFLRIGPDLGFTVVELLITYPLFLLHAVFSAIKTIYKYKISLVIDEIHGLPFFTPLYCKVRKALLVCEVAGPIWDKMYPFPINTMGKIFERIVYHIYRHTETWAISQNTKDDIYRLNKNQNIKILPLGIDPHVRPQVKKFSYPSAVFLGRIVKMKGVETAIQATADIVTNLPKFRLYIIGSADTQYKQYLEQLVSKLNINKNVIFCGQLSENEKYTLLAKSHFLFHPSYKEGFGLTVLEAGQMSTPSIVRSGSSLDELIKDEYSGLIFKKDSQISEMFIRHYSGNKYKDMCINAKNRSTQYDWDKMLLKSNLI
ncbi:MAG: Glycosyl transferase group 1 [Candidatus Woesebacteria bacterium GW2011_GWB1_39_10]|uniref:Glycosyl transferase group 1 n=1 Tax=Candidatus Woesebacteria bacterium GW2011_GWB1_39_10 TaxID=1618572 RepID=A0A0G0P040_9BACT|nr:MAG: Glycosyl transferase group 1 [Candidatus Woesebacteria bacterium GW2011_GWB1_39_10]